MTNTYMRTRKRTNEQANAMMPLEATTSESNDVVNDVSQNENKSVFFFFNFRWGYDNEIHFEQFAFLGIVFPSHIVTNSVYTRDGFYAVLCDQSSFVVRRCCCRRRRCVCELGYALCDEIIRFSYTTNEIFILQHEFLVHGFNDDAMCMVVWSLHRYNNKK